MLQEYCKNVNSLDYFEHKLLCPITQCTLVHKYSSTQILQVYFLQLGYYSSKQNHKNQETNIPYYFPLRFWKKITVPKPMLSAIWNGTIFIAFSRKLLFRKASISPPALLCRRKSASPQGRFCVWYGKKMSVFGRLPW